MATVTFVILLVLIDLHLTDAAVGDVAPFCLSSSICPSATESGICIGVEDNTPYCYGDSGSCVWGGQCASDADCSPTLVLGPKYADPGRDCDYYDPNNVGNSWNQCACISGAYYATQKFLTSPTYKPRNAFAFAAVSNSGQVLLWGADGTRDVSEALVDGAFSLAGNRASFAAVDSNGDVQAWGIPAYFRGNDVPQSAVALVANEGAYSGITTSGVVFAFGGIGNGNILKTSTDFSGALMSDVAAIIPSSASFAALKLDGTVYTWGNKYCGGGISSLTRTDLQDIDLVVATRSAFAGRTSDGAVLTWGGKNEGGDSSEVSAQLQSGIVHIVASQSVFVAYTSATGLVAWGNKHYGGDITAVAASLASDVTYVAYTSGAFAAVLSDGSVVTWGDAAFGGDSSAVQAQLTHVNKVYGNHYAFAALKIDGSVVAWGDAAEGGSIPTTTATLLTSGVTDIYSTHRAFAAYKKGSGQIIAWGNAHFGGDTGNVATFLSGGVRRVCSNEVAFTAILDSGTGIVWGHSSSVPNAGFLTLPDGITFTNHNCV